MPAPSLAPDTDRCLLVPWASALDAAAQQALNAARSAQDRFTILDTETDEVLNVAEDERCAEAYMTVKAPDGDIYFFPSAGSSAEHFFGADKGNSCVLRFKPDADELKKIEEKLRAFRNEFPHLGE